MYTFILTYTGYKHPPLDVLRFITNHEFMYNLYTRPSTALLDTI